MRSGSVKERTVKFALSINRFLLIGPSLSMRLEEEDCQRIYYSSFYKSRTAFVY